MLTLYKKITEGTTNQLLLGTSVALSSNGKVLVVGGPENTGGTVYVYSGTDWGTKTTLQASDRATGDQFGWSVDISADGSVIVVGAYAVGTDVGAAYVYSGSSWSTETILTASDGADTDRFGWSVAISAEGSTVVVGAPQKNGAGTDRGAAYIYSGTSWGTETPLVASDIANNDTFGTSVGISGDGSIVAVGSPFDAVATGAVYVYSGTNWTTETKLTPATAGEFGQSVDVSYDGTLVVAGARSSDQTASNAGSAFVRYGTNWGSSLLLLASDGAQDDLFGNRISISQDGSTIVVGAFGDDDFFALSGSAYVYSGENWGTETKLISGTPENNAQFGEAVTVSGDGGVVVVGAKGEDVGGSNRGAVYAYLHPPKYRRLSGPVHLSDISEVLFYAPLFATTQIRNIHLSNPTGSSKTVTLTIGADASSTRLYEEYVIAADSTLSVRNAAQYILEAGEELRGYASVADSVVVSINGYVMRPR